MDSESLKIHLVEEAELPFEKVEKMSSFELVDAYLKYEGIINYTYDIIEVVGAAYGINLED